jgi:hypothetical protein
LDRSCEYHIEEAEVAAGLGDDLAWFDDDNGVELEPFGRPGREQGDVFAERCYPDAVDELHASVGEAGADIFAHGLWYDDAGKRPGRGDG